MFNKSLIKKQEVIAVALSGGKDSVCLTHLLYKNANDLGFTLKAINVEHGIRGENSLKDSEFVKEFCKSLNVELLTFSVNVPQFAKENGYSEEQAGRILRYECFEKAISSGFCTKVATAHHADDNAETVLLNLFRGSSLSGVCGIPQTALNGKIIRPLLNCTREQIDAYASENNLPFVNDETNQQNVYSRNFIRNQILPLIKTRFEGSLTAINRFSALAKQEDEFLNKLAYKLINGTCVQICSELVLFKRACLKVIKEMGFEKDFTSAHLNDLCDLAKCQTGKSIDLKFGLKAYKIKNEIKFVFNSEKELDVYPLTLNGKVQTKSFVITFKKVNSVTQTQLKSGKSLYIDGDKLPNSAIIRTKRTGDSFKTFSNKTKTLKKYFTDKKIDSLTSDTLALIAIDNKILAVLPLEVSHDIMVDDTTKNIIKITTRKNGE